MPEETSSGSGSASMEEKPCSSTVADSSVDVTEEAKKLIGTGNRHLVMGDVVSAVNVFQEACGMLAARYGDTAEECGEAFFLCGKSLLELARMENTVLGNALEGVPEGEEEEEEEKPESHNMESANNLDEDTRAELRRQVYEAMAEDQKPEGSECAAESEEEVVQPLVPNGSGSEAAPASPARGVEPTGVPEMKGEVESQSPVAPATAAVDCPTGSPSTAPSADSDKKGVATEEDDKKVVATEQDDKKVVATGEDDKKVVATGEDDKKVVATEEDDKKVVATEEDDKKAVATEDEKKAVAKEEDEKKAVATEEDEKKAVAKEEDEKKAVAKEEDEKKAVAKEEDEKKAVAKEEDEKKAVAKEEDEKKAVAKEEDEKKAVAKEEDDDGAAAGAEQDAESEDDDDDDDDDDEDEANANDQEEEDVGNLQLAWEMLEVAKVIYKRNENKEDQLMAAQAYMKLGEVSVESGNYPQALEDFQECLALQLKHLPPHSRLLAASHYHVATTLCYMDEYNRAIEHYNSSIKVIENRLAVLQKVMDAAEGAEDAAAEKTEWEELKQLLPDVAERVADAKESQRTASAASLAIQQTLGGASTSSAFPGENGGSSSSSSAFPSSAGASASQISTRPSEAASSSKSPSDISHLVRKKRKTDEESPVKDADAKQSKQQEAAVNGGGVGGGDSTANGD